MISGFDESRAQAYPREDKCKYCGAHIGYILNQMGEAMALGVCDKPKCIKKKRQESHKKKITGGKNVGR